MNNHIFAFHKSLLYCIYVIKFQHFVVKVALMVVVAHHLVGALVQMDGVEEIAKQVLYTFEWKSPLQPYYYIHIMQYNFIS